MTIAHPDLKDDAQATGADPMFPLIVGNGTQSSLPAALGGYETKRYAPTPSLTGVQGLLKKDLSNPI